MQTDEVAVFSLHGLTLHMVSQFQDVPFSDSFMVPSDQTTIFIHLNEASMGLWLTVFINFIQLESFTNKRINLMGSGIDSDSYILVFKPITLDVIINVLIVFLCLHDWHNMIMPIMHPHPHNVIRCRLLQSETNVWRNETVLYLVCFESLCLWEN